MKFYVKRPKKEFSGKMTFPCCVLSKDNWNDLGYNTLYSLTFFQTDSRKVEIGNVKILSQEVSDTNLPESFTSLVPTFCSLGQSPDYYEKMLSIAESFLMDVTSALNDVVAKPLLIEKFREMEGFQKSLLRMKSAQEAFTFGHKYFDKLKTTNSEFPFEFSCKVHGAAAPHVLRLGFTSDSKTPTRIIALVGKNGTGKTAVLGSLCKALKEKEIDLKPSNIKFHPRLPTFSRVFGISYSLFDKFPRPKEVKYFDGGTPATKLSTSSGGYYYLGLRNGDSFDSDEKTTSKIVRALRAIRKLGRQVEWQSVMDKLLGTNVSYIAKNGKPVWRAFNELSSGQSMIVAVFTELIANIQNESLILFDEPETHLHPNAIANLMIALNALLEQFNSYAIISTHSPLVIQEIPSRQIRVFRREGNYPMISNLEIESFGENLSNIANQVFDVTANESFFRQYFKKMIQNKSEYSEIENLFENKLSLNAKIYLNTLLETKSNEKS